MDNNPMDRMSGQELADEARGDNPDDTGSSGQGVMSKLGDAVSGIFGGGDSGDNDSLTADSGVGGSDATGGVIGARGRNTFTEMLGGSDDTVDVPGSDTFDDNDSPEGAFLAEEHVD